MVKIRKGTQILNVPTAAFNEFYKAAGWEKVERPVSSWENKVRSLSNSELRNLAQEKGIKAAGVSKKALIETLINSNEESNEE